MFSLMVCIGLRGRRQKARERGGRGKEEEKKGKGMAAVFGRSDFLDSLGDQGVVIIMGWLV